MASSSFLPSLFFILCFIFHLTLTLTLTPAHGKTNGNQKLIFEEGYTVNTLFDGDKSNFKVNPHSILPRSPPSDDLFILLDSVASTFYTVSLPTTSNKTVTTRLAGNGDANYMDGDLDSARFNKPKSFAVDYKGNVYVADPRNHAIRKITNSGVTTIAGGSSQKPGRTDGPARDASFSDDFELTFLPERCALMISDRGNRLVRQIVLKAEDCKSQSGSVLGTSSSWLLSLSFSCLLGLIFGFVIRPYVIPHECFKLPYSSGTWKHSLMSLKRQIAILCSDIRNAVVKSTLLSLFWRFVVLGLSHISLMFRLRRIESRTTHEELVSLLDCDEIGSGSTAISAKVYEELKGLYSFEGKLMLPETFGGVVQQEKERGRSDESSGEIRDIDGMIQANLANFGETTECSMGLVRRR